MGCYFLLQRIFLTQGLNLGLPHCRQTLYHLSHQGSPQHPEESLVKTQIVGSMHSIGLSRCLLAVKSLPANEEDARDVG